MEASSLGNEEEKQKQIERVSQCLIWDIFSLSVFRLKLWKKISASTENN